MAAKDHLEELKKRYHRRRLRLAGAERLSEVIENHNVIRAEKVCMGEFVVRKVYRYSGMTKVQVPLLAALLYLMICLLYPKAWIGFDWNPQYVRLTKAGFEVLNADFLSLWTKEYDCDSITMKSRWEIGDLDGDGKNEVAFVPKVPETLPCESNANLFVYDDDGTLSFRRHCAILGEYPGDTSLQQAYSPHDIDFVLIGDSTVIVTRVYRSYPARLHLKFWSANGDSVGWYINAGHSGTDDKCFTSESQLGWFFLSYNNRMRCACLFALNPFSSVGVSPPYSNSYYEGLGDVRLGNQLCYVLFPRSDLNRVTYSKYNNPCELVVESDSIVIAEISETTGTIHDISYYLDKSFRVYDIKAADRFVTRRKALVANGKLPPVDLATYLDKMRDSVAYWTDSGWVTEGQLRAVGQK